MNKKVLHATHRDLDGAVCGIILRKYFPNSNIIAGSYRNINDKFEKAIKENYDLIFITDISINEERFRKFLTSNKKIHFIDHHPRTEDSIICNQFLKESKYSASLLTKNYLRKYLPNFDKKWSEDMDKLVRFANDYDTWTHEFIESKYLNRIYYWYSFDKFVERFEDGMDCFNEEERNFLKINNRYLINVFKNLDYIKMSDDVILTYTSEGNIDEICEYLKKKEKVNTVFIYNMVSKSLSLRSTSPLHSGDFLKSFGGGGHKDASAVVVKQFDILQDIVTLFIQKLDEFNEVI